MSALTPENIDLIWEDITYQQDAGFVRVIPEHELPFDAPQLKISRSAVVPQANRRGRIILNLSAPVEEPRQPTRRNRSPTVTIHPSVNDTTVPADDQAAVQALGGALPALLLHMFDTPCTWTIVWFKLDLSDGFWRMVVQHDQHLNFVFQLPKRATDAVVHYVVPASLQMGWKNSPAYLCTATQSMCTLILCLLALTCTTGIPGPHRHEHHFVANHSAPPFPPPSLPDFAFLLQVFVDDFMGGLAFPPTAHFLLMTVFLWIARAALHVVHACFPPPDVSGHNNGRDSISEQKLAKGDALLEPTKTLLGFELCGLPGPQRTIGVPADKIQRYRDELSSTLKLHWVSHKRLQTV
jgi:hypothetical protein